MDLVKYDENLFENIKHVNEYGQEFWYARELQKILEYTEWRNFTKVIDRAKEACNGAGHEVSECFVESTKHRKCLMAVQNKSMISCFPAMPAI